MTITEYDRAVGAAVSPTGRRASLGDGARVLLALIRIANGSLGLLGPSVISRPLVENEDLEARRRRTTRSGSSASAR